MSRYGTKVISLTEPKSRLFFPEEFSNEIYYSNLKEFTYFSYRSNFSIKYIRHGKESYVLDGKKYSAKAGQYLLVNSGRIVETTPECNSEALSIFVDMDIVKDVFVNFVASEDELLNKPYENIQDIEFFECAFSNRDLLGQFCGSIYSNIITEEITNLELSKETYFKIAESLLITQKDVQSSISGIHNVKRTTREELYRRALTARDYIESNSLQDFDFESIARNCGMSKYHLIRTFKAVFGTTPYQYFIHNKVKYAKEYLKDSSLNILMIAYSCGFNDLASFSKTFKKVSGLTPSQYRENLAQLN